jgi:hypothetical protein
MTSRSVIAPYFSKFVDTTGSADHYRGGDPKKISGIGSGTPVIKHDLSRYMHRHVYTDTYLIYVRIYVHYTTTPSGTLYVYKTKPSRAVDNEDTVLTKSSSTWTSAGTNTYYIEVYFNSLIGDDEAVSMELSGFPNASAFHVQGGYIDYDDTAGPTAPAAPTGLTKTTQTTSSVTVSWTAPDDGGSAITNYRIRYRKHNETTPTTWTSPYSTESTTTSDLIGGLSIATKYEIQVAAENAIGIGEFSTSLHTYTGSAIPTGLAANASDVGQITINWNAISNDIPAEEDILYDLDYSSNNDTWFQLIYNHNSTTYVDSGLGNGVTRYYRVRSKMPDGTVSSFSSSVNATTWNVPGTSVAPVFNILGFNETIIHQPSPPSDGGTEITHWRIHHKPAPSSPVLIATELLLSQKTFFHFGILSYENSHWYAVDFKNAVGWGDAGTPTTEFNADASLVYKLPTNTLVVHYPFDRDIQDYSGNAYHPTADGVDPFDFGDGLIRGGLLLNTPTVKDHRVSLNGLSFGILSSFTLITVIKPITVGVLQRVFYITGGGVIYIEIKSTNEFSYLFNNGTFSTGVIDTGIFATADIFYTIIMEYTSGVFKLFINNNLIDEKSGSGSYSFNSLDSNSIIGGGTLERFRGIIDEFILMNGTLSSDEREKITSPLGYPNSSYIKTNSTVINNSTSRIKIVDNLIQKNSTSQILIESFIAKDSTSRIKVIYTLTKESISRIKTIMQTNRDSISRIKTVNTTTKDSASRVQVAGSLLYSSMLRIITEVLNNEKNSTSAIKQSPWDTITTDSTSRIKKEHFLDTKSSTSRIKTVFALLTEAISRIKVVQNITTESITRIKRLMDAIEKTGTVRIQTNQMFTRIGTLRIKTRTILTGESFSRIKREEFFLQKQSTSYIFIQPQIHKPSISRIMTQNILIKESSSLIKHIVQKTNSSLSRILKIGILINKTSTSRIIEQVFGIISSTSRIKRRFSLNRESHSHIKTVQQIISTSTSRIKHTDNEITKNSTSVINTQQTVQKNSVSQIRSPRGNIVVKFIKK